MFSVFCTLAQKVSGLFTTIHSRTLLTQMSLLEYFTDAILLAQNFVKYHHLFLDVIISIVYCMLEPYVREHMLKIKVGFC